MLFWRLFSRVWIFAIFSSMIKGWVWSEKDMLKWSIYISWSLNLNSNSAFYLHNSNFHQVNKTHLDNNNSCHNFYSKRFMSNYASFYSFFFEKAMYSKSSSIYYIIGQNGFTRGKMHLLRQRTLEVIWENWDHFAQFAKIFAVFGDYTQNTQNISWMDLQYGSLFKICIEICRKGGGLILQFISD